jgi:hypothetical protein
MIPRIIVEIMIIRKMASKNKGAFRIYKMKKPIILLITVIISGFILSSLFEMCRSLITFFLNNICIYRQGIIIANVKHKKAQPNAFVILSTIARQIMTSIGIEIIVPSKI